MKQTIRELRLYKSANFDSLAACELIASFVAEAPALEKVWVSHDHGDRKVFVQAAYAPAERSNEPEAAQDVTGTVTVRYKLPVDLVICQVPIQRRASHKLDTWC